MVEKGTIIKISGKTVTIERDEAACTSCRLAALCSPAEKGRTLAFNEKGLELAEGDSVAVSVPERKDEGYGIAVLFLPMLFFVLCYALSGAVFPALDALPRVLIGLAAAGAAVAALLAVSSFMRKKPSAARPEVIAKLHEGTEPPPVT